MTDPLPSRIYLTGFMGAGKTAIGKELALLMKRSFIDSDNVIEELSGKSVTAIFSEDGETRFRELEKAALKKLVASDGKYIIALGGGTTCEKENLDLVMGSGYVVYLQLPAAILASRLENYSSSRPLLRNLQPGELPAFIEKKLEERKPFYEKAHLMVNGINLGAPLLYEIIRASVSQDHT